MLLRLDILRRRVDVKGMQHLKNVPRYAKPFVRFRHAVSCPGLVHFLRVSIQPLLRLQILLPFDQGLPRVSLDLVFQLVAACTRRRKLDYHNLFIDVG